MLYQPTFVPVKAARAVTPSAGLTLLSLFGWTLGGVFVVEWADSPIGPYKEVAVLSGLVARDFRIGAWASHIVVTTPEAVAGGAGLYGLPTRLGRIDLAEDSRGGRGREIEFLAEDEIGVRGWADWLPASPGDAGPEPGLSLTLPSFSGRLPAADAAAPPTPLLRYPLTLGPARRVRICPPIRTRRSAALPDALRDVLGGPVASPCLQVDGVDVVAGVPVEVSR